MAGQSLFACKWGFFLFYLNLCYILRGLYYTSYIFLEEAYGCRSFNLFGSYFDFFLGYVLLGVKCPIGPQRNHEFSSAVRFLAVRLFSGYGVIFQWEIRLNKFFTLHFIFPFIILGLVIAHFIFLHLIVVTRL